MRIGVAWEVGANRHYRAIDPVVAMQLRGHQLVPPPTPRGEIDVDRLLGCDVVHVYRLANDDARRKLARLTKAGVPLVYDNDDDLLSLPKGAPGYATHGGLRGQQIFSMTVRAARMARVFTTTTEVLADKYRRAGIARVEVIPNYLRPAPPRPRVEHDGVVIGWVAGGEHHVDAVGLKLGDVLGRVLDAHPDVRLEVFGVDLGLRHPRYAHEFAVRFEDLPERMASWDIGLAPLTDIPMNRARSDIKLKEYAASGVAWLASPVGPYLGLGERQGGRLVGDDAWFDAIDSLVRKGRDRRRLAEKGRRWAEGQTIRTHAERWEAVFEEAAAAAAAAA
jgi:glycosyltransferase involved in cell wall biosynthesis